MDLFMYAIVFIFGAVIGSFLNVVIYRLHTGRSLDGRSHCMSCGKTLSWFELIPIVSYLCLRGKCRGCGSYIPHRYFTVEVLTGLLFTLVWYVSGNTAILLVLNALVVAVCVVMLVYDMRHMIIPDELTVLTAGIGLVFVGYNVWQGGGGAFIIDAVLGSILVSFFFFTLWFLSKGRWIGFGDVKLGVPFGLMVGLQGAFSLVVFSFWIGAIIGLSLIGIERMLKRGQFHLRFFDSSHTIKSEVPFAPFFISGFLLVHLLHADVFIFIYSVYAFFLG